MNSPAAGKTKARKEPIEDLTDAVIKIETELGTDPAGSLADVKTFLQTHHQTNGTHKTTHGPHVWIDAADYNTLTDAANAAIGKTLVISSSINLTLAEATGGAVVIPATVLGVFPMAPGVINKNTATSFTCNAPVVGNPMHKWLSGFAAGEVTYPQGPSYAEWFGLVTGASDGTANLLAFNCALAMSNTTITKDGDFSISGLIIQPDNSKWTGNRMKTIIRALTGATGAIRLGASTIFSGFSLRCSSGHTGFGLGVCDDSILRSNSVVRDIDIRGFNGVGGSGIKIGNSVSMIFENIYTFDNDTNLLTLTAQGPTETTFIKCQFNRAVHKGTKIYRAAEMTFFNCDFESNEEEGFYAENGASSYVWDIRFKGCHSELNWESLSSDSVTRHTKFTFNFNGTDGAGVYTMQRILFDECAFDTDTSNTPKAMTYTNTRDIKIRGGNISNESGQITANGTVTYGVYSHPSAITPGAIAAMITNNSGAYINIEGYWRPVTYGAGLFVGNDSMTWTVASGDVTDYSYMVIGETMYLNFHIDNTTVGGTPSTQLRITLPNSYKGKLPTMMTCYAVDNGVITTAKAAISADTPYISILREDGVAWAAATDTTSVRGQLTFAVKR